MKKQRKMKNSLQNKEIDVFLHRIHNQKQQSIVKH